jgi:hypothetical protein
MEKNLCPFKSIFGEPNTGVHSYRIMDFAIVDIISTIILAYVIAIYFNEEFYKVLIATFLLGIIMHRLFCVRTTIDKILF